LQSTPQQSVTSEYDNGQSAIQIQPVDPQVMYVPSYNPAYVWGPPVYGYYPPLWYPPVSYGYGFGPGVFLGDLFSGFLGFGGWGWGLSWFSHGLFLNAGFFNHFGFGGYGRFGGFGGGRTWWAHNPTHRLGIAYPNRTVAGRFGSPSRMDAARNGFRSFGTRGLENRGFENRGFENRGAAGGFANRGFENRSAGFANRSLENGSAGSGFANRGFDNGGLDHRSANGGFNRAPQASQSFSAPARSFSEPRSNGFQNFNRGVSPGAAPSFSRGSSSGS